MEEDREKTDAERNQEQQEKTSPSGGNSTRFRPNGTYFTIAVYAVLTIIFCALFITMFAHWGATSKAIGTFFGIISPFLWGILIACVLQPLISGLLKVFVKLIPHTRTQKLQHFLAILSAYVFVVGLLILGLFKVVPQIVKSIADLAATLPQLVGHLNEWLSSLQAKNPSMDFTAIEQKLNDLYPDLINKATSTASDFLPQILNFSVSVVRSVLNVVIAIIVSVYLVADSRPLKRNAKRLLYAVIPLKAAEELVIIVRESVRIFTNFVVGKAIDSLIIGILCSILMSMLQLPYVILLSVIVGVTNMIPYFGPFIGAIPGVVLYLLINPMQSLIFAIMIFLLQQFDGLVLGPKILGDSTGLKPVWIIIAITVGGAMQGVVGMFLGVPVLAVLSYLLERLVKLQLRHRGIDDPPQPEENKKSLIKMIMKR